VLYSCKDNRRFGKTYQQQSCVFIQYLQLKPAFKTTLSQCHSVKGVRPPKSLFCVFVFIKAPILLARSKTSDEMSLSDTDL